MRFEQQIYGILAVIIVSTVIISILSAWYFYPNPQIIQEDFENGFGEWVADADVPLDPNNPGHPVEWHITRVTSVTHSGQYSLEFFIDGGQDDGTIWIERKINVKKNSQIQVKVSFEFYSEQESFNTIAAVCAYAGIRNPEVEEDLAVLGPANEVAGWKNYTYRTNLSSDSSEEVWVALGITVRWETYMTYYIDDVEMEIK